MAHLLLWLVVGTPWLLLALLHILKSSLIRGWIFTRWSWSACCRLLTSIVIVIPIIPLGSSSSRLLNCCTCTTYITMIITIWPVLMMVLMQVWLLMLLSCIEIAIVVITWWKSMLESIESLLPLSGSLICCCSRSSSRDRRLKSGKTWFVMKVMFWRRRRRILMLVASWTFGRRRRNLKGKLCHNVMFLWSRYLF